MKVNSVVLIGIMTSLSIILGVVENFIPNIIPAVRLGISNIPILLLLYLTKPIYAFEVAVFKSTIVPIFSGNIMFKLSLSVPSTILAFIAMFLTFKIFKNKVSPISVSVLGAFTHMASQLTIISIFYIKGLIYTSIAGILLLMAVITGIIIGAISYKIINHSEIKRIFKTD